MQQITETQLLEKPSILYSVFYHTIIFFTHNYPELFFEVTISEKFTLEGTL